MDEQRLAAIEARLRATTPGPWRHGSLWDQLEPVTNVTAARSYANEEGLLVTHEMNIATPWQHVAPSDPDEGMPERVDWLCYAEGDARFLAHAHQDVTDLLAEVRRLRVLAGAPPKP